MAGNLLWNIQVLARGASTKCLAKTRNETLLTLEGCITGRQLDFLLLGSYFVLFPISLPFWATAYCVIDFTAIKVIFSFSLTIAGLSDY